MKKLLRKLTILAVIVAIALSIFKVINLDEIKKEILQKIYKIEYAEYVEKYAKEYDVDKYLIFAMIKAESNFDENAESSKQAKGLMQLMYSTAEEVAKKIGISIDEENILNPEININLGTKYISMLIQKYGNIELAIIAYNAGSGNVDSWIADGILKQDGSDIENVPYMETNNYVRKILRDYRIYKEIYE